ncbi:MAG: hypothetical protein SH856_08890 [Flavobacteriales bacterium]|nr:hypothetical protein [Flavobacteriales bacterium]
MKTFCFALLVAFAFFSCTNPPPSSSANSSKDSTAYNKGCGSRTSDKEWYLSNLKAPLFEGLDGIHFPITTKSAESQQYFDQGLMLSFAFNHAEAARSFWQATRFDSTCAMCWWGFAYVLGPNYNAGMEPDNFERAHTASQKAMKYSASCREKEKSLIEALTHRYSKEVVEDRSHLDDAYAVAMKGVHKKFPGDVDIASLYAESLMDMHPWDLYEHDGTPKSWTPEIVSVLEECLAASPQHVGANHFYIHAVEASLTADRGLPNAKLLENLVPGAGHLVHMPSHIYIRTGHYNDGVLVNERACEIDSAYVERCHAYGAYPLAYYPHNAHFIAACAALSGQSAKAMEGAWKTSMLTAEDLLDAEGMESLQHYYIIPWYTSVKFAQWETILEMKMPHAKLKYPMGIVHYSRGMARCGLGKTSEAEKELAALREIMKDTTVWDITIWNINSVGHMLQIAEKVLSAHISSSQSDFKTAEKLLREAVSIEDNLAYNEPPDWFFSVRHYLGNVLLQAKKFEQAERVFREDLVTFPENGFALNGLHTALAGQNKIEDAGTVQLRFNNAWRFADCLLDKALVMR